MAPWIGSAAVSRIALHRDVVGRRGLRRGGRRGPFANRRAQDERVASLVKARDIALFGKAKLDPCLHFVPLDEGVDPLDPLAHGERLNEQPLGRGGARAEVDDAHQPRAAVDEKAQRHRVVVEEDLLDRFLLQSPGFGRHVCTPVGETPRVGGPPARTDCHARARSIAAGDRRFKVETDLPRAEADRQPESKANRGLGPVLA